MEIFHGMLPKIMFETGQCVYRVAGRLLGSNSEEELMQLTEPRPAAASE